LIVLPDTENRTIVFSFVWTKHWNVTGRQTDSPYYYSGRHWAQCGRAVKMKFFIVTLSSTFSLCRYTEALQL